MKMSVNEWRWRSSRAPLSLVNRSPSSYQLHDNHLNDKKISSVIPMSQVKRKRREYADRERTDEGGDEIDVHRSDSKEDHCERGLAPKMGEEILSGQKDKRVSA
jgi:hypothetical protein